MGKIIGLDMGTNSIGWVLLEDAESTEKIIDAGSRIFSSPVEAKTDTPLNEKRREARGRRRNLARFIMRKKQLHHLLTQNNLLPESKQELDDLFHKIDPYYLRAEALDRKLTEYEVGQALYHLNQRRGFKSNRKTGKAKDDGKVLSGISELSTDIENGSYRTLGEYLYRQEKKRERYTSRDMYEHEFNTIWEAQSKHHVCLTEELKTSVYKAIFFQRPLKIQKHLIGYCQFESIPIETDKGRRQRGKKRCAWAHPLAQRFRFLQDVNNMTANFKPLTKEQRSALTAMLESKKEFKVESIRKAIRVDEDAPINMESSKKKLKGAATTYDLSKAVGLKVWSGMTEEQQENIYEAMFTIDDEEKLRVRLRDGLSLNEKQTEALMKKELESGYCNLSLRAIKKILPHLEAGLAYANAVQAAGYEQFPTQDAEPLLPSPPTIRNPVVQKALYELRKVVNGIIRKHGKPDVIRIELARELKQPKKIRDEISKRQKQNQKTREDAMMILQRDFPGIDPQNNDAILRYLLWKECACKCPYTMKPIPASALFSGDIEIEHILPWSRSLDNSYMNKTLTFSKINKDKGEHMPWEAFGGDEQKWDEIEVNLKNTKSIPTAKKRRILMKEMPDGLAERYLNDTRYISREAKSYLGAVCEKVYATSGKPTAMLRRFWGLNSLLPKGDPEKKDRGDHRHHMIDAVVIALTNHGTTQLISKMNSRNGWLDASHFPMPWDAFRDDVKELVESVTISHSPARKISGALHQETVYGKYKDGGYCHRKSVISMKETELKRVKDPVIQQMLIDRLEKFEGDWKKASQSGFYLPNKKGEKVPIKTVRLIAPFKDSTVRNIGNGKYVKLGSNSHIEIFKHEKTGKRKWRVITTIDAAKRVRGGGKKSLVDRTIDDDGHQFEMSLFKNDLLLREGKGKNEIFRVVKFAQNGQIAIRLHNVSGEGSMTSPNPNTLNATKISISPIGEVFPAND